VNIILKRKSDANHSLIQNALAHPLKYAGEAQRLQALMQAVLTNIDARNPQSVVEELAVMIMIVA
jgi:hypothetical protein